MWGSLSTQFGTWRRDPPLRGFRIPDEGPGGGFHGLDSGIVMDGNPGPAFALYRASSKLFQLPVKAGYCTIKADVLQPNSDRAQPELRVIANSKIGLGADMIQLAPHGDGWVEVSASFTAIANGAVSVEIRNPEHHWDVRVLVDNIRISAG